jgi:hypothetical protein
MATLIDYSYFEGVNLNLPQVADTPGRSIVQKFIDKYEPKFLQEALGYQLWKDYTIGTQSDQKWLDLTVGKEFTYSGYLTKWNGFKPTTGKISPIANYVYCQFMWDRNSDNNLVGVATPNLDNASRSDPSAKICEAWNEMVDMIMELKNFLNVNSDVYSWQYNWGCKGIYNTINILSI